MDYDELVAKQITYDQREVEWLDSLWAAASELKAMLVARLGIPDSYINSADKTVPFARLIEAQVNISEAAALSRKDGLPVDAQGVMPFVLELRLRLNWSVRSIYIFLGARVVNGQKQYSTWHLPGEFPSKEPVWMQVEQMLAEIDGELQRYVDHNPETGSRKDAFIH
jgi:hypothetical protein